MSGTCFHFLTSTGVSSVDYGGILLGPVILEVNYPVIDGKVVEVTATSGVEQYLIVEPGDYPTNELDRDKRRELS